MVVFQTESSVWWRHVSEVMGHEDMCLGDMFEDKCDEEMCREDVRHEDDWKMLIAIRPHQLQKLMLIFF